MNSFCSAGERFCFHGSAEGLGHGSVEVGDEALRLRAHADSNPGERNGAIAFVVPAIGVVAQLRQASAGRGETSPAAPAVAPPAQRRAAVFSSARACSATLVAHAGAFSVSEEASGRNRAHSARRSGCSVKSWSSGLAWTIPRTHPR